MSSRPSLVLSFVLAWGPGLAAQGTWIVDPTGAGHFTTLTQANAAAAAGDTLMLVGTLPGATVTRPLHILAHGASVTTTLTLATAGPVSVAGGFFTNIVALGTVASLDGVHTSLQVDVAAAIVARQCTFGHAMSFHGASVAPAAIASFDGCTFQGRHAAAAFGSFPGSAGLRVDGMAQLRSCTVAGGNPHTIPGFTSPGAAAIQLFGGTVELRDCVLTSGAPASLLTGSGTVRAENTTTQGTAANPTTVVVTPALLPWTTGVSAGPGGTIHVRVDGPANTLAAMSVMLGMRAPFASPFGPVWLEPLGMVPLVAGITDAVGSLPATIAVPLQGQRGLQLPCQSALFLPSAIVATAPAVVQIL